VTTRVFVRVRACGAVPVGDRQVGDRQVVQGGAALAAVEPPGDHPRAWGHIVGDGLGLVVEARAGLEAEGIGVGAEVLAGAHEELTPGEALMVDVGVALHTARPADPWRHALHSTETGVSRELQDKLKIIEALRAAIAELRSRVIQVCDQVPALPVIGQLDDEQVLSLWDLADDSENDRHRGGSQEDLRRYAHMLLERRA